MRSVGGGKRIAKELGIARNSVRRYVRDGAAAETQARPNARTLDDSQVARAAELLDGPAQGNGAVVKRLLSQKSETFRCARCSERSLLVPS